MQTPELCFLPVDGAAANTGNQRRIAYWDWSGLAPADTRRTVICVHGLSRQARDFDVLARALAPRTRVLAVDVAGRGHSDWLADPQKYQVPTYVADMLQLLAHVRAQSPDTTIDWVGTSLGGLIGMLLAAQPAVAPRRLVLNDIGPTLRWEAIVRIGAYLGQDPSFENEQDAFDYLAQISAGFGPHTPQQWADFSRPMLRQREGRWRLHYDPAIALSFKALSAGSDEAAARRSMLEGEATLWAAYDAIRVPTLLLRGAQSDLLTEETAQQMTLRGPRAHCTRFAGVGHAPTLLTQEQVAVVRDFLWSH